MPRGVYDRSGPKTKAPAKKAAAKTAKTPKTAKVAKAPKTVKTAKAPKKAKAAKAPKEALGIGVFAPDKMFGITSVVHSVELFLGVSSQIQGADARREIEEIGIDIARRLHQTIKTTLPLAEIEPPDALMADAGPVVAEAPKKAKAVREKPAAPAFVASPAPPAASLTAVALVSNPPSTGVETGAQAAFNPGGPPAA